jgi:hypothetical protein
MDFIHRIAIGAPLTPNELRLAGCFALMWFALDLIWFTATLNHWWGL